MSKGIAGDAEAGERYVEDHRCRLTPPYVLKLGTALDIKFWFILLDKLVKFASHLEVIRLTLPQNLAAKVLLAILLESPVPDDTSNILRLGTPGRCTGNEGLALWANESDDCHHLLHM